MENSAQPTHTQRAQPQPSDILGEQPTLFDRSNCGQILLDGADRVRFLHNQTTNNIQQLQPNQGCHTVFVTSTGRTIDLASVYMLPEAILLSVSPNMAKTLYDWMDRYIFFSDKVTLKDKSEENFLLTLVGNNTDSIIETIGASNLIGKATFSHDTFTLPESNISVRIAVNSDLAIAGYTLVGNNSHKDTIIATLTNAGATSGTIEQWEQLRIQQGYPQPAHELTEDDNPLEAGLWHSVSFEKGCYIGQETIARLNTYQGVKKRLWGILFNHTLPPKTIPIGTTLTHEGQKVGRLTSIAHTDSATFGLAYLRTKAGEAGLTVQINDIDAQIIALPFITHQYYSTDKTT